MTGEQNKHARKQHRLVGARSTGIIRSSGPSTQARPIEFIVDQVVKAWKAATDGKDNTISKAAARELAMLFRMTGNPHGE